MTNNPRWSIGELGRLAISIVIDQDPIFAYTAWHQAHSIVKHVKLQPSDIHIQFTSEVPSEVVDIFRDAGFTLHRLARFGDGRYCNKLAQWENLRSVETDHVVFLDADMICIDDFSTFLPPAAIAAKVVDLDNPPLDLLDELFRRAGFRDRPPVIDAEATDAKTYRGNCNGGFYSVPVRFAESLFGAWRHYAQVLLDDIEPLRHAGKENHVDQISFCMAIHHTGMPFEQLPSNVNYYLHFAGPHPLRDVSRPLAQLHYHNASLNVLGLLEPACTAVPDEEQAIVHANDEIRSHFQSRLFWDFRYKHFPERGSGIGSRGENLSYKRDLLKAHGAEEVASVLDVGCGDLQVVGELDLKNYVGVDRSSESLALAIAARPDWTFLMAPAADAKPAELVLCFEVAIHQETAQSYHDLINYLISRALKTLIVSGYDEATDEITANHMTFFYESLHKSLDATGHFKSIRQIGHHSSVVVYRCDV
ncbi:class I SAM-dependent methyltransferase [Lichenihabitans sp. PAMC28606]|uniref:class I SAM-dependent methyltransferase n=1 Tax=Lichenihabitans sp. PAMC28606 TaxID=2880932 RepID=UPI001D0B4755|nr:class I SAM-dependent methyltransferase [Lichenihabitans sp. PAMC28606]UDL95246.1 class I SAM-dependent methyltransferase [Lichenihabitans sp. PAMC28606]